MAPLTYLVGPLGSGKTRLALQLAQALRGAVFLDLAERTAPGATGRFALQASEQAILFAVFNRCRNSGNGFLLLSADVPPSQLTIREDLRTRMGYCLVYDVKPLNDQEKINALISLAQARQLTVEPEIFHYLLNHWRRDMDSLMQMLETLTDYAAITRKRITLPLLRQLLKQQENQIYFNTQDNT